MSQDINAASLSKWLDYLYKEYHQRKYLLGMSSHNIHGLDAKMELISKIKKDLCLP